MNKQTRINSAITAPQVRLIDASGKQIGIVSNAQALEQAREIGLDLVEIGPSADPPVVKIIDWDKFRYQQIKLAQKAKKKHRVQTVKQMRFGLKIGQHDLDVKLRKIRGFLETGDKVKIAVMFRGREITHPELGHALLKRIIEILSDLAIVDQSPQLQGRFLQMVLRKR